MKRMFWFGLGIAAGVAATRRAHSAVRRITPAGAAENVGDAVRELAVAIGSFGADVRAGMAEREAELHATVIQRTGIDTTPHHLARTGSGWASSGESSARADWAGGSASARS
jgi:chromosome condensin MukBEF MukE localization factor